MIRKKVTQTRLLIVLGLLIIVGLTGCAVKMNIWGDPKTGLILIYRIPEGRVFQYQTSSEETEKLEMMGQTMKNKTKTSSTFSVQAMRHNEKNLKLRITLDDMMIRINSSMIGNITPDLSPVIGKSFDMILSPQGKELDFFGTESLQYKVGSSGKRNIESSFNTIFPDLAGKPVKIGDIWKTKNETTEKAGGLDVHVIIENLNTFKGLETIYGLECSRIETKITGTFEGKGKQMGANITFKGNIKGVSTWYFAYKQGIFVKIKTDSTSEGTVLVTAQNMTIPMSIESKSEIYMVK
jgi:hypothetical protein